MKNELSQRRELAFVRSCFSEYLDYALRCSCPQQRLTELALNLIEDEPVIGRASAHLRSPRFRRTPTSTLLQKDVKSIFRAFASFLATWHFCADSPEISSGFYERFPAKHPEFCGSFSRALTPCFSANRLLAKTRLILDSHRNTWSVNTGSQYGWGHRCRLKQTTGFLARFAHGRSMCG